MEKYKIDDIEIVLYRKQIKNINIKIKPPKGVVQVSAPIYISKGQINNFIKLKRSWILKSQKKILQMNSPENKRLLDVSNLNFEDGSDIYLFGKKYTFLQNTAIKKSFYFDENNSLACLNIPKNYSQKSKIEFVKQYYKDEVVFYGMQIIDSFEKLTHLKAGKISAKFLKSRWGSCNSQTKNITLNAQLATLDLKYLSYVCLHELLHVKYPNHGSQFKMALDKYMPQWRDLRKQLNNFG